MHEQRPTKPYRASDVRVVCTVVACAAVVGVPLGWLWQSIAPRTRAYVNADGFVIPEESESQIAADGRALILCAGLGLILGVGLWLWRDRRGPLMTVAVVIAASGAALVMDVTGKLISGGRSQGATGDVFVLPVEVHARAVLVAAPLLALLGYCIGALFISRDDLGRAESDPADHGEARHIAIEASERCHGAGNQDASANGDARSRPSWPYSAASDAVERPCRR